jgi:hypothetical protein
MLSKEICERCWREYSRDHGELAGAAAGGRLVERGWVQGFVHCNNFEEDPRYNGSKYDDRYPITSIPVCCHKKLEQAIAAGKSR